MTLTPSTGNLKNRRKAGARVSFKVAENTVLLRTNRNLMHYRVTAGGEPHYITIGHTFTKDGTRVDVVRPWALAKAAHRHNEYLKRRNNAALLKGMSDEV